jgi:hypothetical protein
MQRATTAACPAAPRFVQPRDGADNLAVATRDLPRGAPARRRTARDVAHQFGEAAYAEAVKTAVVRHVTLMAQRARGMRSA